MLHYAYAPEGDGPRIVDKRQFPAWCAEHGLPAAPILAEWDNGVLAYDALPTGTLPARDLFSKPADMNQGWQTARWRYDGAGGYVGRDGQVKKRYAPTDTPESLRADIEAALAEPQR